MTLLSITRMVDTGTTFSSLESRGGEGLIWCLQDKINSFLVQYVFSMHNIDHKRYLAIKELPVNADITATMARDDCEGLGKIVESNYYVNVKVFKYV